MEDMKNETEFWKNKAVFHRALKSISEFVIHLDIFINYTCFFWCQI